MKKIISTLITGTVVAALCVAGAGCKKQESNVALPPGTVSAEKNSFAAVSSKLDTGGNFYLYLSTEQMLEGLSTKVANWRGFIDALPNMDSEERAAAGKVFDVVTSLIRDSGIEEVSGFGMSSISTEKGIYHSKSYLHHYPGKAEGFLWKLCGVKPHELAGLEMLPSTTAVAFFSDLDVSLGWSVVVNQVRRAGFPEAENFLNQLPVQFEQRTGLKWEDVLASLGGEFGVVFTLDESKIIRLPIGGDGFDLPEPGLVLVAKVKNNLIFDRIDKAVTDALSRGGPTLEKVDSSGLKMRSVQLPVPSPIQLRPSYAVSDGYLFLALNGATIQEMLAAKAGKSQGLKSTDEFKRLSKNVPLEGNEFLFLSQRFGKTIIEVQKRAMQGMRGGQGERAIQQWLQSLMNPEDAGFAFTVSANTDEGWLTVGNGHQNPAVALIAAPAAVVGVMAAIALPNFVRAKEVAQRNACINNLRQIDGAKQQWALENSKTSTAMPTQADLQPYLGRGGAGSWPQCPQGGQYNIGSVGSAPTCSIPGHALR